MGRSPLVNAVALTGAGQDQLVIVNFYEFKEGQPLSRLQIFNLAFEPARTVTNNMTGCQREATIDLLKTLAVKSGRWVEGAPRDPVEIEIWDELIDRMNRGSVTYAFELGTVVQQMLDFVDKPPPSQVNDMLDALAARIENEEVGSLPEKCMALLMLVSARQGEKDADIWNV